MRGKWSARLNGALESPTLWCLTLALLLSIVLWLLLASGQETRSLPPPSPSAPPQRQLCWRGVYRDLRTWIREPFASPEGR